MCRFLRIARGTLYYLKSAKKYEIRLEEAVREEFKHSRNNYGTRKLKVELAKRDEPIIISRRKISRIMKKYGLISNYTLKHYKDHSKNCNEDTVENIVNRNFDGRAEMEVAVSDLTYVRVKNKWHYICSIIDLYNREIIGYSAGKHKDAQLVHQAFSTIKGSLQKLSIFHTDRGCEFKNMLIDDVLKTFGIKHSLSHKGCPYDNAVAEATFKIIKTEFAFNKTFKSLDELQYLLFDYVNWYNTKRIHGSLGYKTPVEYKFKVP